MIPWLEVSAIPSRSDRAPVMTTVSACAAVAAAGVCGASCAAAAGESATAHAPYNKNIRRRLPGLRWQITDCKRIPEIPHYEPYTLVAGKPLANCCRSRAPVRLTRQVLDLETNQRICVGVGMDAPHLLIHDKKDTVGVVVVEGLKAGADMLAVVTADNSSF